MDWLEHILHFLWIWGSGSFPFHIGYHPSPSWSVYWSRFKHPISKNFSLSPCRYWTWPDLDRCSQRVSVEILHQKCSWMSYVSYLTKSIKAYISNNLGTPNKYNYGVSYPVQGEGSFTLIGICVTCKASVWNYLVCPYLEESCSFYLHPWRWRQQLLQKVTKFLSDCTIWQIHNSPSHRASLENFLNDARRSQSKLLFNAEIDATSEIFSAVPNDNSK